MTVDTVIENPKRKTKNCLIRAIEQKGRDAGFLYDDLDNEDLLNFKFALRQIKKHGVTVDDLYAEEISHGMWHITDSIGLPLTVLLVGDNDKVGWIPAAIMAAGMIGSSLIGNKKKQEQIPLETPEQEAARRKLMDFANTGKFGNFTAGKAIPLGYGDYGMTGIEGQGQSALQDLLNQGLPSQYAAGDAALADYLKTDPADVAAQYDPFKTQVQRQIKESNRALKRNAGFAGNLYSTDTIRNLGDIENRGNETLTSELARLTDNALNRRLQAIPLAYQSGEAQQAAQLAQIQASQQYGGLTRQLNDASIKARDAEILRRRQEMQLPIQVAQTVTGQQSNFGVPSINTSPYGDLLGLVGQIGGQYLSNLQTDKMMQRYYPSGGGSAAGGYNPYAQGNLPRTKLGIGY